MNPAQMSSPPLPRSSLPPSSAQQNSLSPNVQSSTRQATRRTTTDALSFGDEGNDAREDVTETSSRRRRRPRAEQQQQLNGDVPIVKDAVGESVAEAFEAFLKT